MAQIVERSVFNTRYDKPLAIDRKGRSEWGTTAAVLHQWQASVWPALPPDVAFSLHGLLSTCDSCCFGRAQPAVLLRGARVFRTDSKAQCIGCAPHTWSEKRAPQRRYVWVPNVTRAHTFREMWDEVPLSELDTVLQSTFRLVLFPVTDLELVDAIMNLAPIREVTVRQGAVLYDVERWLTPRVTRLSLHSAECVTDHTLLHLLGHVQHLTSLHLVSVSVTNSGFQQLLPELTQLTELVIADTSISAITLEHLNCKSTLRRLHFQVQSRFRHQNTAVELAVALRDCKRLNDLSVVLPVDGIILLKCFEGLMAPPRNAGRWNRLSIIHMPPNEHWDLFRGTCWTRFGGRQEICKHRVTFSFSSRKVSHRDFGYISMRTLGSGSAEDAIGFVRRYVDEEDGDDTWLVFEDEDDDDEAADQDEAAVVAPDQRTLTPELAFSLQRMLNLWD